MNKKDVEQKIKTAILVEMNKKPTTLHQVVVEITKTASAGLTALDSLKKKKMPTKKSRQAFDEMVSSLDALFQDMLKRPIDYLDKKPKQMVDDRVEELDSKQEKLSGNTSEE